MRHQIVLSAELRVAAGIILRALVAIPVGNPLFRYMAIERHDLYRALGWRELPSITTTFPFHLLASSRYLAIHMDEPARQRARDLANTPEFANAQRERKKVEALFAELKNQIGLRRLRLRRSATPTTIWRNNLR